jgi:hypothetical protein
MTISRKTLLSATAFVIVLFAVALPLGDDTHGIGAHHKVVADIGNAVFAAFGVAALLLVALFAVAGVQALLRKSRR